MRIKITAQNVWDENGKRHQPGDIIDLGDVETLPAKYRNKATVLDNAGRAFVVNPGETDEIHSDDIDPDRVAAYRAALAKLDPANDFVADGRPKVSALNANLADAINPFDADERTTMWAYLLQDDA